MKLYPSINRPENLREKRFEQGDRVVIQEKIDGSNIAIWFSSKGIRVFSRTTEILEGSENFQEVYQLAQNLERPEYGGDDSELIIFGEWLGQGKIGYNAKARKKLIDRFYMFDCADIKLVQGEYKVGMYTPDIMLAIAETLKLKTVPIITDNYCYDSFDSIKNEFVDNQVSLIDNESMREGVVIKATRYMNPTTTKIVADKFKEVRANNSPKDLRNPYDFIEKYITPMRIEKFLQKIKIENDIVELTIDNYSLIFKNLDKLSDDILEEENVNIKKDINRIIKKQSISFIKEYLRSTSNEHGR